ncbi:substrate-binding domain-containing protein [Streptomyces triticirhizae]|uniref:histidine kinase n=1 Tax=Streptomyces triticirhizae TaxID=2483353 RepID=A0A3M2LCT3_9ACTN|nr:substrate-binding domain-containing protein [Streptomyces triticirhizae]RMI33785.1 helix-turn-helix domain-containing protein [Streptomyces triticirhizae]
MVERGLERGLGVSPPDRAPGKPPAGARNGSPAGAWNGSPAGASGEPPAGRRPLLGLVTANIHLGVGATLWSGVRRAAEAHGASLVALPGDAVRVEGAPRNALYELLPTAGLDGVICWTSTLGLPAAGERAARLVRELSGLPVVSLNRALEDHETLLLDSHAGMRKAVGHLVTDHGRRRLACIRGPLTNPVALDRARAYSEALRRHRLPQDRSLTAASLDYAAGAGAAAMRVLIDVRGLRPGRDFDAVVACSDALAADALRFLTERGVRVPEDVALISFNDSVEARISDPPLTSVALPFGELGALAVETLLARLRGTAPPARRVVSGTLIVRGSCGCHSPLVEQVVEQGVGQGAEGRGFSEPAGVRGSLTPTAPLDAGLLAALPAGPGETGVDFLRRLERALATSVRSFDDAVAWDRALLGLRAGGGADPARLERLVGQARLLVADKSRRLLEYERWTEEQRARRLRALATTLTTVTDTAGLRRALERHLPGLGVPGYRLALREPAAPAPPPLAEMLPDRDDRDTGVDRGAGDDRGEQVERAERGERVERGERGRFTAVLEPLHIGDEQLGYAVFEADPGDEPHGGGAGALYRALGDQISAALKGVRLFTEVRGARDAAERASRFKTRLLDNATDELRSPVEAILRHTAEGEPAHEHANRLLRLIDDLLDLSRSEIDALDLSRQLLDPLRTLTETFRLAGGRPEHLRLPSRLPVVRADEGRLTQIVLNLLVAAGGPGLHLAAEAGPRQLDIRVDRPGLTVEEGEEERLFQPFASGARGTRLGLAIARRLAVLHGGSVTVDRVRGRAGFRLTLPLPTPADAPGQPAAGNELLVLAADGEQPPPEAAALARRHRLRLRLPGPDEELSALLGPPGPAAVAWDAEAPGAARRWATARRLLDHPALRHTPFLLYGPLAGDDLHQVLHALRPSELAKSVLVVDGSAERRERARALLTQALPGRPVRAAADGTSALALLADEAPGLLVVDRALPDMAGLDVVERLPGVPALLLSDRGFTVADARRAEPHPALLLLGREILTEAETARLLALMLERDDPAAQRAVAPVRYALAYLEQHYRHRFSRWQVAQAAGVSEDHLGRLFHRELGLTLWEYLTRLRIQRAKERLASSDDSVQTVARAVGFHDRAYFSRVFRRLTGVAPHAYRDAG